MRVGWQAKPGLAQIVRVLVTIGPALFTIIASTLLAKALPASQGRDRVLWWIFLLFSCLVLLAVFDRAFRRLAPISTLLKVSLVFPDKAPSRFAVALRAGNTRSIAKRIESIRESGVALDPEDNYASQMLEMIALLGEHDRLTRGHCERVRAYTDLLIDEMGIAAEDANQLRWAALLHDLGKLMVAAEILNKDGRPTEEEWEELKTHPAEGARLALPLSGFLGDWWRVIGEHHERWDGGGYPSGLAGTEIHLGARMVAVADTFDVITSARSYKTPIEADKARAEIARCSGGQFDPQVVRAFLSIGISKLRFIVGPLAWLSGSASLSGASTVVPAGSAIATAAATLGAVVAVATPAIVEDIDVVAPPIEAPFVQPFESTTTTIASSTTTGPAGNNHDVGPRFVNVLASNRHFNIGEHTNIDKHTNIDEHTDVWCHVDNGPDNTASNDSRPFHHRTTGATKRKRRLRHVVRRLCADSRRARQRRFRSHIDLGERRIACRQHRHQRRQGHLHPRRLGEPERYLHLHRNQRFRNFGFPGGRNHSVAAERHADTVV